MFGLRSQIVFDEEGWFDHRSFLICQFVLTFESTVPGFNLVRTLVEARCDPSRRPSCLPAVVALDASCRRP